jgi:hypothetical protein
VLPLQLGLYTEQNESQAIEGLFVRPALTSLQLEANNVGVLPDQRRGAGNLWRRLNTARSLVDAAYKMSGNQPGIPDIAAIVGQALRKVDPALQPLLLAALEKLAAQRYRAWAADHSDSSVREGLLACADREEEIARRVESLEPNAAAIQKALLSDNPEILDLNRTLFEGQPLNAQFAMQSRGERAGSAAWGAFAAGASSQAAREVLSSCGPLEEANALYLETLL